MPNVSSDGGGVKEIVVVGAGMSSVNQGHKRLDNSEWAVDSALLNI
jgi:hypothetical protein